MSFSKRSVLEELIFKKLTECSDESKREAYIDVLATIRDLQCNYTDVGQELCPNAECYENGKGLCLNQDLDSENIPWCTFKKNKN